MKRTVIPLSIVAAMALFFWAKGTFFSPEIRPSAKSVEALQTSATPALTATRTTDTPASGNSAGHSALASPPAKRSQDPRVSLNAMSTVLVDALRGKKNLEQIVQHLKISGQAPVVTRESNKATGEMTIVRTENPLPGTRYFHAQYFTDENNQRFVQHMSFEFKPGPHAMNDAVRAAIQSFSLGAPTERTDDFVKWDLEDNYILWIKRKSARDLQNDPFKAYDIKKDNGTVQMALEQEIHGSEGDEHHHGH